MWKSRVLLVLALVLELVSAGQPSQRHRRNLIFPYDSSIVQIILGFGVPLGNLPHQSVTTGYVLKCDYKTPHNATMLTRPYEAFADVRRRRRSLEPQPQQQQAFSVTRWHLYGVLQTLLSGVVAERGSERQCLLRALCDAAALSLRHDGLLGELLHALLTPSATRETSSASHQDLEYHAAERLGRSARAAPDPISTCQRAFPGCALSVLGLVSTVLSGTGT